MRRYSIRALRTAATSATILALVACSHSLVQGVGTTNGHSCSGPSHLTTTALSTYDRVTLAMGPTAYVDLASPRGIRNLTSCGAVPRVVGVLRPAAQPMPDGESAVDFVGTSSVVLGSEDDFSIGPQGLTLEAWIRPSTLTFGHTESTGYVNWLGKGHPGAFEYTFRMYSRGNSEGRGNRLSAYVFNNRGGKGSGSYVQDDLRVGEWIFLVAVFSRSPVNGYAADSVVLFKDGTRRMSTPNSQFDVVPHKSGAPLVIGTLDGRSYFQGSIAKVAVFDSALSDKEVAVQFASMTRISSN